MSDRGDEEEESLTSPEPLVSPSTDDATTPANRRTRVCPVTSLLVPVIMAGPKFQTDSTLLNLCVFLVILVDVRKHVTIKSTGNNFFLILCDEQVECNCVCVERNPCKLNWNGLNFSNGYISYVFSSRLYFCRNV